MVWKQNQRRERGYFGSDWAQMIADAAHEAYSTYYEMGKGPASYAKHVYNKDYSQYPDRYQYGPPPLEAPPELKPPHTKPPRTKPPRTKPPRRRRSKKRGKNTKRWTGQPSKWYKGRKRRWKSGPSFKVVRAKQ